MPQRPDQLGGGVQPGGADQLDQNTIELELQLRLLDQLNELCITDIDEFGRAVGDITSANDVARDYFDTILGSKFKIRCLTDHKSLECLTNSKEIDAERESILSLLTFF